MPTIEENVKRVSDSEFDLSKISPMPYDEFSDLIEKLLRGKQIIALQHNKDVFLGDESRSRIVDYVVEANKAIKAALEEIHNLGGFYAVAASRGSGDSSSA